MNRNKLRGRIIEIFGSQEAFAAALETTPSMVSLKLSKSENRSELTRPDIQKWSRLLKIPPEEIGAYFFTDDVAI